jgi:2-polyprenyl-6-hydroxyphenyl methylase / 3-demethylubiquinone-9 3-methyltransferase
MPKSARAGLKSATANAEHAASSPHQPSGDTIDPAEVARFEKIADTWWDPKGPMAVLHKFNPVRLAYVRDAICAHLGRDPGGLDPLADLTILDVGCGGGVLSVPMARLGAKVTGIDPAPTNVAVASLQAERFGLGIDFRNSTVEAEVAAGRTYDVVLAMEVVEHVADVDFFVASCCAAVKPGGLLVMATLNRTLKSFALAIVGAEYVLRWLPRGTHNWDKFVTPHELGDAIARHGMREGDARGVVYNPFRDVWSLSSDTDVNYMLTATK